MQAPPLPPPPPLPGKRQAGGRGTRLHPFNFYPVCQQGAHTQKGQMRTNLSSSPHSAPPTSPPPHLSPPPPPAGHPSQQRTSRSETSLQWQGETYLTLPACSFDTARLRSFGKARLSAGGMSFSRGSLRVPHPGLMNCRFTACLCPCPTAESAQCEQAG